MTVDPIQYVLATALACFAGFVIGLLLGRARADAAATLEADARENPPPSRRAAGVMERYRPVSEALAAQVYLEGVAAARGSRELSPLAVERALDAGERPIADAAEKFGRVASAAYAEGVNELRDALAREAALDIDPVTLDTAACIALDRHLAREDGDDPPPFH